MVDLDTIIILSIRKMMKPIGFYQFFVISVHYLAFFMKKENNLKYPLPYYGCLIPIILFVSYCCYFSFKNQQKIMTT